jgi:hypothetical protein
VVDTKEYDTALDPNTVAYIQMPRYDGKINYSNMSLLKDGLKEYRKI